MFAPEAVKLTGDDVHTMVADWATEITGTESDTTANDADRLQPAAFVPVTTKVVFPTGVTEVEAPVAPVLHEYDDAPLAVSVPDCPAQMAEFPAIEISGRVFVATAAVRDPTHPFETSVPDTVYTVADAGVKVAAALFPPPFDQV